MCGIAGVFSYIAEGAPVDESELLRMRERMRNRGPDGSGLWLSSDRRVGFAHQRLSIIDVSAAGHQPMEDSDSGNQIVFNGEIYNHTVLREELERTGCVFQSLSDTEVLLKMYAKYGREMVHRLRGMYAFAIWDSRKRAIFLARDPLGIKPLYLSDNGRCLRFASQVKALLAGGAIDRAPDPAGLVGFYTWGSVPEPFTTYRSIRALEAGTELWIERGGRKNQTTSYDLGTKLAEASQSPSSIGVAGPKELREALLDCIRHHLVSDVAVGVFLSAGLDSATITALAHECVAKQLKTVTLGFKEYEGTAENEVPLAEALSRQYGTNHETHWITKSHFLESLDHLLDQMDQPSIDGVNTYFVSLAAKEAGLKVAMSGVGGDEIFAGYSDFREIPQMAALLGPVSRLPLFGASFRRLSAPLLKRFTSPKYASLFEYGGTFPGAYLLRKGLYMPWELPSFLDGDLIRSGWRDLNTLSSLGRLVGRIRDPRLKVTALEAGGYMRNQLLRDTDWASMAHSLEVRVPFADAHLFEAVARFISLGWAPSKLDMARTPSNKLPENVISKRKSGFSIPLLEWAKEAYNSNAWSNRGLRGWAQVVLNN